MTKDEMKAVIVGVRGRLRVTKVVATRSVKGRGGDSFVGFSAEFNSVQDDGAQGLEDVGDPTQSGMSLADAKVASLLLSLQVDEAAYDKAMAGALISPHECESAKRGAKVNYGKLMEAHLTKQAAKADKG